jgi:hypothetical protein
MRSPCEISTLKPDDICRGLEIMVFILKPPEMKEPGLTAFFGDRAGRVKGGRRRRQTSVAAVAE